jgi:hypothetical protein
MTEATPNVRVRTIDQPVGVDFGGAAVFEEAAATCEPASNGPFPCYHHLLIRFEDSQ